MKSKNTTAHTRAHTHNQDDGITGVLFEYKRKKSESNEKLNIVKEIR